MYLNVLKFCPGKTIRTLYYVNTFCHNIFFLIPACKFATVNLAKVGSVTFLMRQETLIVWIGIGRGSHELCLALIII